MNKYSYSIYDIHRPISLLGLELNLEDRRNYELLLSKVSNAILSAGSVSEQQSIFAVTDTILVINNIYQQRSKPQELKNIIRLFLEYLRIKMLSNNWREARTTIDILNALVKNSSAQIQSEIGSQYYIKTLRLSAKRYLIRDSPVNIETGEKDVETVTMFSI